MNQILYKGYTFGGVGEDVTNKQHTITLDGQELETVGGENSEIFNNYKGYSINIAEGNNSTVVGGSNRELKYIKENGQYVRSAGWAENNFISGFNNLILTGRNSFITGHYNILQSDDGSFISGWGNKTKGTQQCAVIGEYNQVEYDHWTSLANLICGSHNTSKGDAYSGIFGYLNDSNSCSYSLIAGRKNKAVGCSNGEDGGGVYIFGVFNNANTEWGTIISGRNNTVSSGNNNLIFGISNTVNASQGSIIGGNSNWTNSDYAIICGENLYTSSTDRGACFGYNSKIRNSVNGIYLCTNSKINSDSHSLEVIANTEIESGYENLLVGSNQYLHDIYSSLIYGNYININEGKHNTVSGINNLIHGKLNIISGYDNQIGSFVRKNLGYTYDTLTDLNTSYTRTIKEDNVNKTVTYYQINIEKEISQLFEAGTYSEGNHQFDNTCCVSYYRDDNTWLGDYIWDDSDSENPHWVRQDSPIGYRIIGRTHVNLSDINIAKKTTLLVYQRDSALYESCDHLNITYTYSPDEFFTIGDTITICTEGQLYDRVIGYYIFNGEEWVSYNQYQEKQYYSSKNIIIGNNNKIIPDLTSYKQSSTLYHLDKQYGNNLLLFSDNNKIVNGKNNILINSYGLTLDNDYTQTSIKTEKSIFINYDTNNNSISNVNKVLNFGTNNLSGVDNSFIFTSTLSPNTVSSTAGVFTFGSGNTINSTCYILGSSNTINAGSSAVIGDGNSATMGAYLYCLGTRNTLLQGSYLYGFGEGLTLSSNSHAVAVGYYNNNVSNSVFIVGNGNSEWNNNGEIVTRSNAFEVYKDGCQSIILKEPPQALVSTLGIGKIEITQEKIKFTSLYDNSNNEKETVEFTFEDLKLVKQFSQLPNLDNNSYPIPV